MEKFNKKEPATLESVWAGFRETDRLFKESKKAMKKSSEKFDRELKKSHERFEKEMKESREDFNRRMKKLEETMGAWSNNSGLIAEEYFFNSFEKGKKNFFGEKFDEIKKNMKGAETDDEFDIVMLNGKSIGLVEVKYKAHENDLPQIVNKANAFRINFPKFKKHKLFLGLATMAFYPKLKQECINQGIAVIKQAGDTVVIYDEHLKAY